jgi:hypothetical protein
MNIKDTTAENLEMKNHNAIHCDEVRPVVPPGTRVVATRIVIEGGPMRYRPPKPVTAEDVERIVREAMERLPQEAKRQPSKIASTSSTRSCDNEETKASTATGPVPDAPKAQFPSVPPATLWLSPRGACAYAKCSRQTLWRWREQGLRVGRGGRVRWTDLDAWLGGTVELQPDNCDGVELLRLSQAAMVAGVSLQTIWRWRNDGLKVHRRGRFVRIRSDVLDKFLRSRS